jgi:hypothetical protein
MHIFASLSNILAPPLHTPLAVKNVSELCLDMSVSVFGREELLAEKPNDDSLVVFHPLNENHKRTDLATIVLNILLM